MKLQQTTLAAALSAVLAIGLSGQALASVYARSYLEVDNLHILVNPTAGATIRNFTFSNNISANLHNNPTAVASLVTCGGVPGLPGSGNNCSADPNPRLNAVAVNALGSDLSRTDNMFTFLGPTTDKEYSNADAVIWKAGLTGDLNGAFIPTTHTEQIAESEIQGSGSALSASLIDSITGFTFSFTIGAPGTLTISLDAVQDMLAWINDPAASSANAQATMDVTFKLQKDGAPTTNVEIVPLGLGAGNTGACDVSNLAQVAGFTCTMLADPFSLNTQASGSTDPTNVPIVNSGSFGAQIGIPDSGNYTLTLTQKTSTLISRVPEPATLALLGIGLAGLGLSYRRQKD